MRAALMRAALIKAAELLYPGQNIEAGPDHELCIIWIRPRPELFPDEGAARLALHVNHYPGGAA